MVVVEYILDPQDKSRSYHPKTVPLYITDGGYFKNDDGSEKMIGIGKEGNVPDSLTTFTLEELQTRQRAIHANFPMVKESADKTKDRDDVELTDDEVNAVVEAWWNARS